MLGNFPGSASLLLTKTITAVTVTTAGDPETIMEEGATITTTAITTAEARDQVEEGEAAATANTKGTGIETETAAMGPGETAAAAVTVEAEDSSMTDTPQVRMVLRLINASVPPVVVKSIPFFFTFYNIKCPRMISKFELSFRCRSCNWLYICWSVIGRPTSVPLLLRHYGHKMKNIPSDARYVFFFFSKF